MKYPLLVTALVISALAQGDANEEYIPKCHHIYVGPDFFWDHYKSKSTHQKLGTDAIFGGLRAGYDYRNPNAIYLGTEGQYGIGWGRYKNYVKPDPIAHTYSHREKIGLVPILAHVEQRLGYTFQSNLSCRTTLAPFLGLGWYYSKIDSRQNHSFQWFYGVIGLRGDQAFSENFEVGFRAKVMYSFAGGMHLKYEREKWKMENTWGYEFGIPLTWQIGCCREWDIELQPYLLRLNARSSGEILGIRLLFGYNF